MDKFYTDDGVANQCVERLLRRKLPPNAVFLEPAAGDGAFMRPLQARQADVFGLDIEPAHKEIKKQDFFKFDITGWSEGRTVIAIGNPPFGHASNTAIKFFNHAAKQADIIAFILPLTFRKQSVISRLNPSFHLRVNDDLPLESFFKDGEPHQVPCCWQIWYRQKKNRKQVTVPCVNHLISYTKPSEADFAIKRVGGRAGEILEDTNQTISSHYFIREIKRGVKDVLKKITWDPFRDNTVGVRSISKAEIAISLYQTDFANS